MLNFPKDFPEPLFKIGESVFIKNDTTVKLHQILFICYEIWETGYIIDYGIRGFNRDGGTGTIKLNEIEITRTFV